MQVAAKSSAIFKDKRNDKLVTRLPNKILLNSDSNQAAWCPLRYGEYITYEFKTAYRIKKLVMIPVQVKENRKLQYAKVMEYVIQYGTQKDTWVNVPSKVSAAGMYRTKLIEIIIIILHPWFHLPVTYLSP